MACSDCWLGLPGCCVPPSRCKCASAQKMKAADLWGPPEFDPDLVERMCVAHHKMRERQGFTTGTWDKIPAHGRIQYRKAMKAALRAIKQTPNPITH